MAKYIKGVPDWYSGETKDLNYQEPIKKVYDNDIQKKMYEDMENYKNNYASWQTPKLVKTPPRIIPNEPLDYTLSYNKTAEEKSTPKKSGLLSTLLAPFSKENYNQTANDVLGFLRPKLQQATTQKGNSAVIGAINSVGLGLPKVATEKLVGSQNTAYSQAQQNNPKSYLAGEIAGYLAPGIGATKALKPVTGALTKNIGSALGKQVIEGAIVGAGLDTTQGLIEGDNAKQLAARVGTGALLGAGADIGLNALGKYVPKAIKALDNSAFKTTVTESKIQPVNAQAQTFRVNGDLVRKEGLQGLPSPRNYTQKVNELPSSNDVIPMGGRTNIETKNSIPRYENGYVNPDKLGYEIGDNVKITSDGRTFKGNIKDIDYLSEVAEVIGEDGKRTFESLSDMTFDSKKIKPRFDVIDPKDRVKYVVDGKEVMGTVDTTDSFGYAYVKAVGSKKADYIPFDDLTRIDEPVQLPNKPQESIKPNLDINSQAVQDNVPVTSKQAINTPLQTPRIAHTEESISKLNSVEEIDKVINELKEQAVNSTDENFKGLIMNLQLFAEKKKKELSKVFSNTLMNTDILTDAEKNLLKPDDFKYDRITEQQSLAEARKRITKDIDGEIQNLTDKPNYSGEDVDTMMGILEQKFLKEARETGDYSSVTDWLKNLRKAGTTGGQTVQSFAKYSRTKEGALIDAQRTVDNVEEALKKTTKGKKVLQDIDTETKQVTEALKQVDKQGADEISKEIEKFGTDDSGQFNFLDQAKEVPQEINPLLPKPPKELTAAEKLANKIDNASKPIQETIPGFKDMDKEEETMLRTLFNIAKEQLPKVEGTQPKSPIDLISEALKNKNMYQDVWTKAKVILKDKYKFDDDKMDVLADYLEKKLRPVFEQNKLNKAISMELKARNINLADIVKQHYSVNSNLRKNLTEILITKAGLSGENADYLAKYINNRMKELTKVKKEQVLKQMFKSVPKGKQKTVFEKVQELINLGAYDNEQIKDLIKTKEGLPTLEKEDVKFILEHMENSKKYADGSYEQRAELSLVSKRIANKVPSSLGDYARAIRKDAMLLNPITLVSRNPLSNLSLGSLENLKDVQGSLVDRGLSKITGQRTTGMPEYLIARKGNLAGAKRGLQEWGMDIKNGVDTSKSRGQFELPQKDIFNSKVGQFLDNVVNRGLQLGDRPFFEAAFEGRLRELMRINKVGEPTEEMMQDAMNIALERTLQNDSKLSKTASNLRRVGNETLPGLGDIVLPFTQAPANQLDKVLSYLPTGFIKAGKQGIELNRALKLGDKNIINQAQKKFVDETSRASLGTGILAAGVGAAKAGIATGQGEKSENKKAFDSAIGKQDYALKLGDKYVTYDWLQPIAGSFAAGVDASKEKSFGKGLASGANTIFKQSFLQGISNLFGYGSPAEGFYKTALNAPGSFFPALGGRIAKNIDPIQRETKDSSALKQTLNTIQAKTPFASKLLPPKVDVYGKEVENFGGNNNPFNAFLNPAYVTDYKPTSTDNMIMDILTNTSDTSILPDVVDNKISYYDKNKAKQDLVLSAREKAEFQKLVGQETKKQFDIISKSYNNNSNDKKYTEEIANKLSKAKANAIKQAREAMLKNKGVNGVIK